MRSPMQLSRGVPMIEGPAVEPAGDLLAWIEKNARGPGGERRRLRLPVVVRFEDEYRLSYGEVHVGRSLGAAPPDAIPLELDDTAMPDPLLPALAARVPRDAPGCVLLLEGYWGPLVEGGPDLSLPGEPRRFPFAVIAVRGLLADGAPEGARAQIEDPT